MPRMDGTGPMGFGAKTGFGRGICVGASNTRRTWGFGHGFGRGMGLCRSALGLSKDELLARKDLIDKRLAAIEQAEKQ